MDREEFIIQVYCLVDNFFRSLTDSKRLRARGPKPALDDAEVIAMQIVGEFFGIDGDKGIWEYFSRNWFHFFPTIGDRSAFVRQVGNLWYWTERLQKELASQLDAFSDEIHITDGFPVPICHFRRAHFSKIFKGEATYGYCAAKSETYYGFKGHLVINSFGVITSFCFSAANVDERDVVFENAEGLHGCLLGDKGLMRPLLAEELEQFGLKLQHPVRSNMPEIRSEAYLTAMKNQRRLVETVIGQLTERFNIEKVRARNSWRIGVRFSRKILAHTIGIFLNRGLGRQPLHFDGLVG